jgi:hypothetical protein
MKSDLLLAWKPTIAQLAQDVLPVAETVPHTFSVLQHPPKKLIDYHETQSPSPNPLLKNPEPRTKRKAPAKDHELLLCRCARG